MSKAELLLTDAEWHTLPPELRALGRIGAERAFFRYADKLFDDLCGLGSGDSNLSAKEQSARHMDGLRALKRAIEEDLEE